MLNLILMRKSTISAVLLEKAAQLPLQSNRRHIELLQQEVFLLLRLQDYFWYYNAIIGLFSAEI